VVVVVVEEPLLEEQRDEIIKEIIEHKEEKIETLEEYVTYHIHVVGNNDSLEKIIKEYNTNIDMLNQYNDIKELKVGDKVIIPEYNE
jgi:LysM repeat protein